MRSVSETLSDAAFRGDLEHVRSLVEAGADVNAIGRVYDPLHAAIENEKIEVIKFLLKAGANPSNSYGDGFSALHHAIDIEMDGYAQDNATDLPDATLVQILAEAGADLHQAYMGRTPLEYAQRRHHEYAFEYLLSLEQHENAVSPRLSA